MMKLEAKNYVEGTEWREILNDEGEFETQEFTTLHVELLEVENIDKIAPATDEGFNYWTENGETDFVRYDDYDSINLVPGDVDE